MSTIEQQQAVSYIWKYTGPQMPVSKPVIKNDSETFIDEASFIINSSSPMKNKKTQDPTACFVYENSTIIDFHLDAIYQVCKNPQIIYIGGHKIQKIIKHPRRDEFSIVENPVFNHTNSGFDFRMGMNVAVKPISFWINANIIPTIETFQNLYRTGKQSTCLVDTNEKNTSIGVELNKFNVIINWIYSSKLKTKGMYYFSHRDTARLKRKVSLTIQENKLDYEIFKETSLMAVEDTSKSILIEN